MKRSADIPQRKALHPTMGGRERSAVEVAALNGRTYAHSEARSDNYTPPTPEEAELTYAYRELPINSPEPAEDNRPSRRRENDVMRLMGDGATDDAPEPGDEDDREENAVEHDDEDLDREADGPAEGAAREPRRSPRRAATTPPTSPRSWTRPARTPRAARRARPGRASEAVGQPQPRGAARQAGEDQKDRASRRHKTSTWQARQRTRATRLRPRRSSPTQSDRSGRPAPDRRTRRATSS